MGKVLHFRFETAIDAHIIYSFLNYSFLKFQPCYAAFSQFMEKKTFSFSGQV